MSEQQNQVEAQLEKLKEAEEEKQKKMEEKLKEVEGKLKETEEERKELEKMAKSTIQEIQQKVDKSAKEVTNRNAEHQKRMQELEIEKKLAFKSGKRFHKAIVNLEAENSEINAHFAKEISILKEQLKEKINWNQVDQVMVMDDKIRNPRDNRWKTAETKDSIFISSMDGLYATNNIAVAVNSNVLYKSVCAEKGFIISADFASPILYYFETTIRSTLYQGVHLGLAYGNIRDGFFVGELPNSYAIEARSDYCWISGKTHQFEWANGVPKPEWKSKVSGNIYGCGLLLQPEHELSIFFTQNGILMGKPIPINPTVDYLYPTVSMYGFMYGSVKANFGDNSAKPFKYDVKKWAAEMVFK